MASGLSLHCGSNVATLEQVREAPTPAATATHQPIPHYELLDMARNYADASGLRITGETHGLWGGEKERYFGLLSVSSEHGDRDMVIGLRNSHDKKFPAAVALGTRVFVCDNLAFSGEVSIARRHTVNIRRDLPELVARAMGKLAAYRQVQDARIASYQETEISPVEAHDLVVRAMDAQVIGPVLVPHVLQSWRSPEHPEFAPRNLWSLFNAFTERLKGTRPEVLSRRTQSLHGLLDAHTGLMFSALN